MAGSAGLFDEARITPDAWAPATVDDGDLVYRGTHASVGEIASDRAFVVHANSNAQGARLVRWESGTWGAPTDLPPVANVDVDALAAGASAGRGYVLYHDSKNGQVHMLSETLSGWKDETVVGKSVSPDISIAVGAARELFVSWHDDVLGAIMVSRKRDCD